MDTLSPINLDDDALNEPTTYSNYLYLFLEFCVISPTRKFNDTAICLIYHFDWLIYIW